MPHPAVPNLPLPKDSFSVILSARTLIPAVILSAPQSPEQLTCSLGFLSPLSLNAKRLIEEAYTFHTPPQPRGEIS